MITPIETDYAGHRFRSRLEARWATFFSALGIAWEYEAQGYEVGPDRRRYLPDFWLPNLACGTWVEVKGDPAALDTGLLEAAVGPDGLGRRDAFGDAKILVLGPVPEPGPAYTHVLVSAAAVATCAHAQCQPATPLPAYSKALFRAWPKDRPARYALDDDAYAGLRAAGALLVQWGRQQPTPDELRADGDLVTARPNLSIVPDLPVEAAYRAARRARFEHGESGAA